jgi:hypothetical protein
VEIRAISNCIATGKRNGLVMTKLGLVVGVSLAVALAGVAPAMAKSGGMGKGAYCKQGPDNVFIPASSFKPSARKSLRKGQKVRFNYPGFGPISCVVY